MNEFGKRLSQLRNERSISLDDVAKAVGSTKSTLSKYERGLVDPSLPIAKKICEFFGVTLDWMSGSEVERIDYVPLEYRKIIDDCKRANISADKLEQMIKILK